MLVVTASDMAGNRGVRRLELDASLATRGSGANIAPEFPGDSICLLFLR